MSQLKQYNKNVTWTAENHIHYKYFIAAREKQKGLRDSILS
jgi:hypothetical protein